MSKKLGARDVVYIDPSEGNGGCRRCEVQVLEGISIDVGSFDGEHLQDLRVKFGLALGQCQTLGVCIADCVQGAKAKPREIDLAHIREQNARAVGNIGKDFFTIPLDELLEAQSEVVERTKFVLQAARSAAEEWNAMNSPKGALSGDGFFYFDPNTTDINIDWGEKTVIFPFRNGAFIRISFAGIDVANMQEHFLTKLSKEIKGRDAC